MILQITKRIEKEFIYPSKTHSDMTRKVQSRLSDFGEVDEETPKPSPFVSPKSPVKRPKPEERKLWKKTTNKDEEWGVCNLDETVLLVQLVNGRIHAHGREAVCKWCDGVLEIRETRR